MPTINKQKSLQNLMATMAKGRKWTEPEPKPVLEQFIYAICRENTTRELADQAFSNLRSMFFDWNEVRVSGVHELAEAMEGLPEAEARGQRIIDFLQEVFETTFSFDLDGIQKKGVKLAAKQLSRYQAANDYIVSWVVQHSLEGHAIPLDQSALRVLRRLGIIEEDSDNLEAIRATLEHQIPKAKGAQFVDLLSSMSEENAFEDEPTPAASNGRSKPR